MCAAPPCASVYLLSVMISTYLIWACAGYYLFIMSEVELMCVHFVSLIGVRLLILNDRLELTEHSSTPPHTDTLTNRQQN